MPFLDVSEDTIIRAFHLRDEKRRLLGFGINAARGERKLVRVPRAQLIAWLILQANFGPDILRQQFDDLVHNLTKPMLESLAASLNAELQRRR